MFASLLATRFYYERCRDRQTYRLSFRNIWPHSYLSLGLSVVIARKKSHQHGFLQDCVPDAGSPTHNSSLLGYAADGFGIYGPWYDGKVLTSADLDECHGTTSPVMWDGKLVTMYHYVSTYDFPYTLACYRGTAARI